MEHMYLRGHCTLVYGWGPGKSLSVRTGKVSLFGLWLVSWAVCCGCCKLISICSYWHLLFFIHETFDSCFWWYIIYLFHIKVDLIFKKFCFFLNCGFPGHPRMKELACKGQRNVNAPCKISSCVFECFSGICFLLSNMTKMWGDEVST